MLTKVFGAKRSPTACNASAAVRKGVQSFFDQDRQTMKKKGRRDGMKKLRSDAKIQYMTCLRGRN